MPVATDNKAVEDNYMLSRGFGANLRINLQYYLWNHDLGHIIHPSIPTHHENIRVADIGSGTGIWLMDMSRLLGPSAILDGFDVSLDQSPPPSVLPPNVTLQIHNCLEPPTPSMQGIYDIVHLQNFNSIVKDNNPIPVIENVLAMLKPGGYLTWGEYDLQTWKANIIDSENSDYDDEITKLILHNATFGGTRKPNFHTDPWTAHLPVTLIECGLTNIEVERVPFSDGIATFLMDTFMVASQELSQKVLDGLGEGRGEKSRALIETIWKHRRNLDIKLDRLTVIGMKPVSTESGA